MTEHLQNFQVHLVLDYSLADDECTHIKYRFVSKLDEVKTAAEKFVTCEEWPPARGVHLFVFYIVQLVQFATNLPNLCVIKGASLLLETKPIRDQPPLWISPNKDTSTPWSQIKTIHYNRDTIQLNDYPGIHYNGQLSSPESSRNPSTTATHSIDLSWQ